MCVADQIKHFALRTIVFSCLALPCLVLSCLVLHCLVLPCLVLPCLVLPCLVLSCLVLPCLVFCLSCFTLSYFTLSCRVLFYLVLSCLTLSCLVLSCLVLPFLYPLIYPNFIFIARYCFRSLLSMLPTLGDDQVEDRDTQAAHRHNVMGWAQSLRQNGAALLGIEKRCTKVFHSPLT